ncbi:hypothetical protein QUF95_06450 [Paenibacillus silvae]|uniref:hypothetical protein n=1 Tax=Paenibacillus silvae TaxID=1325358 RepID=UPI00259FED37|nr:hypothetical protein [Paenibacillus silvae]MDM5277013.1 hypothetical protein [Paenibacillus silvae]
MMKRSNIFILDVIYLVCLVLTSLVSFTVFAGGLIWISFWINLVASYAAITALWLFVRYVMQNMERFRRFVPGYIAIGTVLVIYVGCVIFYGLFTGIADQGLRWFVLLHVVTAAVAFMLCAILLIYIRSASQHESLEQINVANLSSIEQALEQLLNTMQNPSNPTVDYDRNRKSVESMIELVKYSDPITPASMERTDRQILMDIELLNEELASQYGTREVMDSERLAMQISRLQSRLRERNQQILIHKS